MRNVYLFQPQFSVEVRKEINHWLPYSVGCLWSYAQQFNVVTDNFILKDIIFKRQNPELVLASMDAPSVCGFSCYVWNRKYCLHLAKLVKTKWPECIIIMGGPDAHTKMLDLDYVDTVVMSEGEESFVQILKSVLDGQKPQELYTKARLQTLDIPSPYTSGIFDKIIQNNPNTLWAMVLETNRGCPFACTFCDWGGTTYSKVKRFALEHVKADLDWAANNKVAFIFCADANFGVFKERDIEIAKMIRDAADRGILESVNLQYAKNSSDVVFSIAKILGNLSRGVTISVQSMNQPTLKAIKRENLSINNIKELMQLSRKYQVSTYTEAILGLPEETLETWKNGLAEILEMGQHDSIDIWFCQLLENSELNSFDAKVQYGIKSITACDYMPFFNKNDYQGIDEEIKLVNATNTMTTEDMVDAYMYGWIIVHFHISGYTQLYAKYCRNVLNISYRLFYDQVYKEIQNHSIFKEHFYNLKQLVYSYLTTGSLLNSNTSPLQNNSHKSRGHGLGSESFRHIYDKRKHAFDLGENIVKHFNGDADSVKILQSNLIFDLSMTLPKEINVPLDIDSWQATPTRYQITTLNNLDADFDFYLVRRKGLLKNLITQID
jgi:hypothetical protein